jgi:hypothetical protein
MSSETFRVLRCDRCHFTVEVRQFGDNAGWGGVSAGRSVAEDRPSATIGGQTPDDLCPGCVESLFTWWREPGEVRQPTPPPPPPKPKPAKVSRAQMAAAVTLMSDALKLQTERAFDVVRDQPTSILNGEIIPGAFAPIGDAAVTAIGRIVAALGVSVARR